jgi:hypothetical protein
MIHDIVPLSRQRSVLSTISIIMEAPDEKKQYLRKLIDLPRPIIKDLKKLAVDADKSLKKYIEEVIVNEVEKRKPEE